jgi:hypothetical protein
VTRASVLLKPKNNRIQELAVRSCVTTFMIMMHLACTSAESVAANESLMLQHLQGQVHFIWQRKDFAQLEAGAKEFREKKTRWPSGGWRLPTFYGGFGLAFERQNLRQDARVMWNEVYAEWQKADPHSATPHIANAASLVAEAWSIRGSGPANEVWPQDMSLFVKRMKEASAALHKHKALASSDPYYYMLAADIGMALRERQKDYFKRLEEGIAKHPDYLGYYYAGARYLSPQWGGNEKDFLAWIDRSAERTRANYGMLVYTGIHAEHLPWPYAKAFLETASHREKLKQGIADTIVLYPTWHVAENMAYVACALREPVEVERVFDLMRSLNDGDLTTVSDDPAVYCRWPVAPPIDPAVLPPPVPGAESSPQKARAPQ